MSMIGNFHLAADEVIAGLLERPESIIALIYPEEEGDEDLEAALDVDKAWHGIHFLLCGEAWGGGFPLGFIMGAGTPVGEVDVGYGPARVFTSGQVADIAAALEPITAHQLRQRYDARAFKAADIYPEIWDEPLEICLDEYVLHYYDVLKEFLLQARAQGSGLIVFVN